MGRKVLAMKFPGGSHKARAKYCVSQSALAKDEKIKKFWEDLANDWMAIYEQSVVDNGQTEKTSLQV